MFCPFCGSKIPDDASFCMNCGKKIPDSINRQQGEGVSVPSYEQLAQVPTPTSDQSYSEIPPKSERPIHNEKIGVWRNFTSSLKYGFSAFKKSPFRVLGLAVLNVIPIAGWITTGVCLKPVRNEEPDFNESGASFGRGFLFWILGLIYGIIIWGIYFLLTLAGCNIIATTAIAVVLSLFVSIVLFIPGIVNFVRNGFGSAFKYGELFRMINSYGWGKYIGSLILIAIFTGIVVAIPSLAMIIPGIGTVLGIIFWIAFCLFCPILGVFAAKFASNMFPWEKPEE